MTLWTDYGNRFANVDIRHLSMSCTNAYGVKPLMRLNAYGNGKNLHIRCATNTGGLCEAKLLKSLTQCIKQIGHVTMIEFVYFLSHSALMLVLGAWIASRHG